MCARTRTHRCLRVLLRLRDGATVAARHRVVFQVVHKTREVDDCKWTDAPNTPEGEAPVDADEEQACFANGGMFTAYAIGKHPVNSFTAGFECCGGADDDTASPAVTNLLSLSTGGSTPCEQIRNRGQCKQEPSCTYDTSYGCRTNPNYKQEDEDEDDWDSAVPEWGPCTGGLKCKEGLKCYTQNNWYSQCLRGALGFTLPMSLQRKDGTAHACAAMHVFAPGVGR